MEGPGIDILNNNFVEQELESIYVDSEDSQDMDRPKTAKETIGAAIGGIPKNSRRFYKFVKNYIRRRKKDKPTEVEPINIVPEDYHTTWARRQASSGDLQRLNRELKRTDTENSLHVVHDMDSEVCAES